MSKVVDKVKKLLEDYAEKSGLEIVDIEYKKMNNGYNLIVFIDKEGGVDIEDCVKFHKMIDEPLDEIDPTNGEVYNLSVSSCGLDRPLKNLKDYKRALNYLIDVKFYCPYNGRKEIQGKLLEVKDETIILEVNEEKEEIDFDKIASSNVVFENQFSEGENDAK